MEILKKIFLRSEPKEYVRFSEAVQLIYTYRYGSLFITSLFYLASRPISSLPYKAAVVISLYIAARILMDLYIRYSEIASKLKVLILLETFVITLLLVPTGGVDSPFIWYALNPVLVAAWFLSAYFCWLNLFLYMTNAALISALVFNKGKVWSLVFEHSYLMLVFILITLLVQLLAVLLRKLQLANKKQQESLEHIMSLHQTVEAFTREDSIENFFQIFTDYAAKLTRAPLAFFFSNQKDKRRSLYTSINTGSNFKSLLSEEIALQINKKLNTETKAIELKLFEKDYYAVVIRSSTKLYGILGIKKDELREIDDNFSKRQLAFLSELSSIILQRFYLEEVNDTLLLFSERNRIADEMHDSVAQRLFSITCGLHILKTKWDLLDGKEVEEQLELLLQTLNQATRELRQSINGLSSKKIVGKAYFLSIEKYLESLAKLNEVTININLSGEEEILSTRLKKSVYRIICEATGNALRHGKSDTVDVELRVDLSSTKLCIKDNGVGFEPKKLRKEKFGLGLKNMQNLIHSFGGEFLVQSRPNEGTQINIMFPNLQLRLEEGEDFNDELKVGNY